ncbi:hypothetical protein FGG08_001144 [Glutinoglossum americanum]|uniref:Uncharacterized protein n=1 Tax=Glutinoglossum americanum TaxID=1670608 RepID=A0A9P8IFE0_9PEZI|nr:hypothetical protein FGG08_001144 [Glutinoglossum americanum]
MPLTLSPEIQSPSHTNVFEMDSFQQRHRRRESGGSPYSPYSPASPQAPFFRGSGGSTQQYSPIPRNFREVPARKSVASYSSNSVNTLDSRTTGRTSSMSDTQYLLRGHPGGPPAAPDDEQVWGIHWWTPFSMIALFILGILGAMSHHLFYASLAGQESHDQLQKIRVGTAMAVFTKATLVGCVVLSYRQRIWYTFRRKTLGLGAIDGLFGVADDPTLFFQWEMIREAKVATAMAVAIWLIPLAAVLSPAALTSGFVTLTNATICPAVPTLNFTPETHNNYRHPPDIDGSFGISLTLSNTTDKFATKPGWFDYWTGPSKNAIRLDSMNRYWGKPIQREGVSEQACGPGWNCTYHVKFTGPGYKCTELASGVDSNTTELAKMGAPFNTSSLAPEGANIYQAVVDQGEYPNPQTPSQYGEPIDGGDLPSDLGVFKTEPVVWIGYVVNTTEKYPADSKYAANWTTVKTPKIFKCEHYETDYEFLFSHVLGQQDAKVTKKTFLRPIIDTTLGKFPNGTLDSNTSLPESNWVRPNPAENVPRYKLTAAYHSLGFLIRSPLTGAISWETPPGKPEAAGVPIATTDASGTRLVDQHNFTPVPNLQEAFQHYYEDLLITLLSDTHLIINTLTPAPCTKSRTALLFHYNVHNLWPAYAGVIAAALASLLAGLAAMRANGVDSDVAFSRIVATTRNPTLDALSRGACLGGRRRWGGRGVGLKFGEVEGGAGGVAHCAFGVEGEVGGIVRGGRYAGLWPVGGGDGGGGGDGKAAG